MRHNAATPEPSLEFIMTKSTLIITKPSRSEVEGDEGFETAAILASTGPLGITAMGAFPLSLIASGQIRRRHFDDTLTLRPKRPMNATEELEVSNEVTSDDVRELNDASSKITAQGARCPEHLEQMTSTYE